MTAAVGIINKLFLPKSISFACINFYLSVYGEPYLNCLKLWANLKAAFVTSFHACCPSVGYPGTPLRGSPPKETHFSPGIVDYVENKTQFSAFKPYQYWCQNNRVVNSNLAMQKIYEVVKGFEV